VAAPPPAAASKAAIQTAAVVALLSVKLELYDPVAVKTLVARHPVQ